MEQELRRLPDGTYTGAMTDEHICGIFGCCGDWNRREVRIGALTVYVYAIDGITSGGDASEYVVKPLMQDAFGGTMDELYDRALHRTVYNSVAVPCGDLQSTAEKLVNGFTVVLFGQRAIAFETKTGEKRSPSAPEVENTVKGPKDAFTETVRTNTSLLRRHLRTPALRLYETVVGRRSLTNVTLAWIDGLTDPALVSRMQARLAEIDIDGLLTPAAVEEYLTGSRPTAFPLLQYTERTDRFAQALLEGRAGLLVDGLPLGYLAPVDLGYLMTSAEDRGTDFVSASFLRVLRYAALLLGLLLPGLYVAMAAFHPQMLPTELLQSILESKRAVPFPTIVEVLGLLAAFELLQEASVSLPQSVGQSLSIIGGLVVGYVFSYFFTYIVPALTGTTSMLASKEWAWVAIVVVLVWQACAQTTIIYITGLSSVPEDVYEAGALDGATGWDKFRYLTFPLIMPSITTNMVLVMKDMLMVFDQIVSMTSGGPDGSTEVFLSYMYKQAYTNSSYGYGMAIGVVVFAFSFALSAIINAITRRDVLEY